MVYADDITITSTHPNTSAAIKYIQPYLHKVKQSHTKSRQNNLHSVDARPCRIYEQSRSKNTQQCTAHGKPPKSSGSYLRPKTHIQHTHPQHLSTRIQTFTNHKSTHCNRMGSTEGDTHGYLQGSYETTSGVCLFHMVASYILDQQ